MAWLCHWVITKLRDFLAPVHQYLGQGTRCPGGVRKSHAFSVETELKRPGGCSKPPLAHWSNTKLLLGIWSGCFCWKSRWIGHGVHIITVFLLFLLQIHGFEWDNQVIHSFYMVMLDFPTTPMITRGYWMAVWKSTTFWDKPICSVPQRIHVWNIYLHWDYLENYFRGQCR